MAQSMKNMFFYISVDVKMNLSQIVLCSTTQKYAKYLISTRKLLWRCNVFWTSLTLVTHNAIKISTLQRCPMSNVQCNVFSYCNMDYNIIIINHFIIIILQNSSDNQKHMHWTLDIGHSKLPSDKSTYCFLCQVKSSYFSLLVENSFSLCTLILKETAHICNYHIPNSRKEWMQSVPKT